MIWVVRIDKVLVASQKGLFVLFVSAESLYVSGITSKKAFLKLEVSLISITTLRYLHR